MIVGFQCFNEAGSYQIDGVYPQFVFLRKLQVVCDVPIGQEGVVSYCQGTFALDNTEIFAIASPVLAAPIYRASGVCRLATATSTTVTVYIFGPVQASPSTFGFQVYSESGRLVFDAEQKPMMMVGFPVGEGDFTYTLGHRYATLVTNQYLQITSTGHQPMDVWRETRTMGMSQEISNGARVQNRLFYDVSKQLDNNGTADVSVPAFGTNRHIIIDVTYY